MRQLFRSHTQMIYALRFALVVCSGLIQIQCQTSQKNNYLMTGNQYAKDGLWREAVESYRRGIAKEPQNLTAHRNLGMVLVKVGNYKDAIRYLEKSLALFRDNFDANYYLAEAFRASEKFADAIFYYQKALKIKSHDTRTLKALAWSYFRIRYYSEALTTAGKLYKIAPRDSQSAIITARTLIKLKRFRDALNAIRNVKEEASKHDLPYLESVEGDVFFELNQIAKAGKLYKNAIKKQPLLAGALLGLGKCYLRQKKLKKAITYIERASRIRPFLTEAHLLLGKAWEPLNWQKAIKHYQNFKKQASTDPEYLGMLADVKKRIATLKKEAGSGSAEKPGKRSL